MTVLEEMGARAKAAARVLASAGRQKEVALKAAAQALLERNCFPPTRRTAGPEQKTGWAKAFWTVCA